MDIIFEIANRIRSKGTNSITATYIANYLLLYGKENAEEFIAYMNEHDITLDKLNFNKIINDWAKDNKKHYEEDKYKFISLLGEYRGGAVSDGKIEKRTQEDFIGLNKTPIDFFKELIQNADDVKAPDFEAEITEKYLKIHYNEDGMTARNVIALSSVADSDKGENKGDGRTASIGEKGLGFKTVFEHFEYVKVISGGYKFTLHNCGMSICDFNNPENTECPEYESKDEDGTTMWLYFRKDSKLSAEDLYNELNQEYGVNNKQRLFSYCPVLFTNNLRKLTVTFGENSFSVGTTKNDKDKTFKITAKNNDDEPIEIECFCISGDVEITKEEFEEYYKEVEGAHYQEGITRRIEIIGCLDKAITEGNVYSFLPTHTKINAPLCVQLPVKLNENRSGVFFDENGKTISWNRHIIEAFIELIPAFYDELGKKIIELNDPDVKLYRFIPDWGETQCFFYLKTEGSVTIFNTELSDFCKNEFENKLVKTLENIKYFKVLGENRYCTAKEAVIFDKFINKDPEAAKAWAGILEPKKTPIELDDNILEYSKRIGLTPFDYQDIDDITEKFNELIYEKSLQEKVIDHIIAEEEKSVLFKKIDYKDLEIYKANTTEGCMYLNGTYLWIGNNNFKSRKSDFFHFTDSENIEKYKKVYAGMKTYEAADLAGFLEAVNNYSLSVEQFEQLCDFLYDNESKRADNAVEHCQKLLESNIDYAVAFAEIIKKVKGGN